MVEFKLLIFVRQEKDRMQVSHLDVCDRCWGSSDRARLE